MTLPIEYEKNMIERYLKESIIDQGRIVWKAKNPNFGNPDLAVSLKSVGPYYRARLIEHNAMPQDARGLPVCILSTTRCVNKQAALENLLKSLEEATSGLYAEQ